MSATFREFSTSPLLLVDIPKTSKRRYLKNQLNHQDFAMAFDKQLPAYPGAVENQKKNHFLSLKTLQKSPFLFPNVPKLRTS